MECVLQHFSRSRIVRRCSVRIDDVIREAAEATPNNLALVTDQGAVSFGELLARVETLGIAVERVTEPGDRVAILAENRAEYVEVYYAVPAARRILVPLNHRLHASEWTDLLHRSGARMLIAEPELLARLNDGESLPSSVSTLVTLPAQKGTSARWCDPQPTGSIQRNAGSAPALGDRDVAWLLGTSGTTGSSKLAMLTHSSLLAAVEIALVARPVGDNDVLLTPFPLCHVAGYNVIVMHRRGRPVILMQRFDPVELARLVKKHQVTMLSLAPTMIGMLLDSPDVKDADLGSVRMLGYGASPISGPVLKRVVTRWDWDCSQGYGMTELSGNAVFLGPREHRSAAEGDVRLLNAAGLPAPGVELRLSPDNSEILVRSPQVMPGYWEDEEASSVALQDGWLHTGDIGRIDADGLLTIVDRAKDVIVTGGENVASREVEEILLLHPAVHDVAVVGLPNDKWGEIVCAVVVIVDGSDLDEVDLGSEIVAVAREHLAGFKVPREVVFVTELPRNAAGKVLKKNLRNQLAEHD